MRNMVVALRKESVDRNIFPRITGLETPSSLSARRAWIEIIGLYSSLVVFHMSLSARRAWIEIHPLGILGRRALVALRKESVDRNMMTTSNLPSLRVALRKESVDRNATPAAVTCAWLVALRKESVDRNPGFAKFAYGRIVALRKESVDRNWQDIDDRETISASLSARRAWIEMPTRC